MGVRINVVLWERLRYVVLVVVVGEVVVGCESLSIVMVVKIGSVRIMG